MLTVNRQIRDLIWCPSAALTVLLILMHQSVIAGSSIFLVHLIEAFQQGRNYHVYLILYFSSMLFPYVPGCLSYVTLQSWINTAHQRLTERFSETSYGLTCVYRNAEIRKNVDSVVSRNSFSVISDYLTFLHDFFSFFLNSFLSMLVLGILLPGNLLTGYFFSVFLCLALVLFLKNKISTLSQKAESQFIVYSEFLTKIWDNAVLGNKYNFGLWTKKKEQLAAQYYSRSVKLQMAKQVGNLILACASLGPTIYLVFHLLQDPIVAPGLIAAVIVNFTRIFHILNSLSSLVYQLLEWTSMNARLGVVFEAEALLSSAKSFPLAPAGKMNINEQPIDNFDLASKVLMVRTNGRFTIRGSNGSGKSTFLQLLKQRIGDQAMLLPTNQGDLCWQTNTHSVSTGQSAVLRIQEASSQTSITHFLLDEWDANLDQRNSKTINALLDDLSKNKVIIEVRH